MKIINVDKKTQARTGIIITGKKIQTPMFMPVATKGAVKTLTAREVGEMGYEVILSNTYHLLEKPGLETIKLFGGLRNYMSWEGALLTDSGGYQVYSLHKMVNISEEGVEFRSLIDGKRRFFSPEAVLTWQKELGSDFVMVLDVCLPYGVSENTAREASERTIRWAKRSKMVNMHPEQSVFGIVQGSFYKDLRIEATKRTVDIGFDGYAIGGLSVGEPRELMWEMVEAVVVHLPEDHPRYLMGVGDPEGILRGICFGIDMFDSALPTRIARGGTAFTEFGKINIRNTTYMNDENPIEESCSCLACSNFTRSYIRHLYLAEETLALRLLTLHNLSFLQKIIEESKLAIERGKFLEFKKIFLNKYKSDVSNRNNETGKRF